MEQKPTFLDRKAARVAQSLLQVLREGEATSGRTRLVRAALRYYVAPWDLIPDVVPGIGILDDYILLLAAAAAVGATRVTDDVEPTVVAGQIRAELGKAKKRTDRGG
jgi:uncharacterized membrane protein YkvA (DUF1232 family)